MGASANFVFVVFVFLTFVRNHYCYDTVDYEIFDLVEEVNKNFYEVFGVDQSVSTAELKRVYRRLAIQYHPDKNKEEGATEQFQQITSIYEILKDEDKRQRYNVVLETGLPDWKQPVYYYRRVRKLGLAEMSLIVLGIMTVGHFFVQWASYYEKRYEMEEVFRSRQRKEKRSKGRHKQLQEAKDAEFEEQLQEHLDDVPKPRILDLVPFRLIASLWWVCVYMVKTPGRWKEWQEQREEQQRLEKLAAEEEERMQREFKEQQELQKARRKKPVDLAELRAQMMESEDQTGPVVYGELGYDGLQEETNEKIIEESMAKKAGSEWTDDEMAMLAKAVAKFPGGTAKRWLKISQMVGRTSKEVIAMSKNLQQDYTKAVSASAQGITGNTVPKSVEDNIMTQAQWNESCHANDTGDLDPDSAVISAGNAAVRRRRGQRSKPAEDGGSSEKQNAKNLEVDRTKNISQDGGSSNSKHNSDIKTKSKPTAKSSLQSAAISSKQSDSVNESATKKSSGSSKNGVAGATPEAAADDSVASDGLVWSQEQQKTLEWALANIPKGTADRWGQISGHIPNKTKEECMARYRYLAEIVKKRKMQQQQAS